MSNTENNKQDKNGARKVNEMLYAALKELWEQHEDNGGTLKYSVTRRGWISNTLDIIEVGYFRHEPEGQTQEDVKRNIERSGKYLTDSDAYEILTGRLNSTQID